MKLSRNLLHSVVLVLVFFSFFITNETQEILLDTKLYADNSTEQAQFGKSVAVDGEFMVIGSNLKNDKVTHGGSVYCFQRTGVTWSFYQILEPLVPIQNNNFGVSVAISGDTILIGADQSDKTTAPNTGLVYVFRKNKNNVWKESQILIAPDGKNGDLFGISISIDRTTALIGASNQSGYGAAYIFVEENGIWSQQQKIWQYPRRRNSNFGFSVSVQGGVALVGAYKQYDTGAAYIFENHGSIWIQNQEILAHDREFSDEFGYSVSLSGKTFVVGSPLSKKNGALYVFEYVSSWKIKSKLKPFNSTDPFRFGESSSIFGDILVVGTQETPGEVFIFKKTTSNLWVKQVRLFPSGGNSNCFGCSTAIDSTESVIIGAYQDNTKALNSGAVYYYSVGIPCEELASDCRVETLNFPPLSPVILIAEPLLLGILIVLLIGVVVLLGWCIHVKRQKDILQNSKAPNVFADEDDSMEEVPLNLDGDASL